MSELELLPCPKCGLTGIHACMGGSGSLRVVEKLAYTRTTSEMPVTFRLAKNPSGETFFQAGYHVSEGFNSWIEWKTFETVLVDENGRAEGDHLEKGDA